MNVVRLAGAVCLGLAAASAADAQTVEFALSADTALTVVNGDSAVFRLWVTGIPGSVGVKDYSIVLFYDDARVQLVRADAVAGANLPAPTISFATGQATLAAAGTGVAAGFANLADVWFRVINGAVEGSLVSAKVNSLTGTNSASLLAAHRTSVLDVCQANTYWGDVTGEHAVTSRDALVALTTAVGLPTQGFDLSPGDVDEDGVVTSRDALFILNWAIRLDTESAPRLGLAKANRCAPLAPVPGDMAFFRGSELWKVASGDTLPVKFPPKVVADYSYRVAWSPDGQRVLYSLYASGYSYEVLSSTSPFTTVDTLTKSSYYDLAADWSPDGRRIAFISDRVSPPAVFKMGADGSIQTRLTNSGVTPNVYQRVAFGPDGKRIAFIGYSICCSYGIWVTHADSSFAVQEQVLAGIAGHNPTDVSWNATGDSIFYRNGTSGDVYVVPYVPAAPGPATGVLAVRLVDNHDSPAATDIGPAFRRSFSPRDFFVRRTADGRILRILHGTNLDEVRIAVRRSTTYIQSVTVSAPASPAHAPIDGTISATAVVTDANPSGTNTTAPLTWIARDPAVVFVSPSGPRTADITGLGPGGTTYVVVTAGGWRSDSIQVIVP